MQTDALKDLLNRVSKGDVGVDEALQRLKALPFENVGFACIDHHRGLRRGLSEVIFGEGKASGDIVGIMERMVAHGDNVLVTRLAREKAEAIQRRFPESSYRGKGPDPDPHFQSHPTFGERDHPRRECRNVGYSCG